VITPKDMKPVMLATDGSPTAQTATSRAIELARGLDSELIIVSVWRRGVDEFVAMSPPPVAGFGDMAELREKQARRVAEDAAAWAGESGVSTRTVVLPGPTVEAIASATEKFAPRVLVLGSHGWGVLGRRTLGSRAAGVLANARCPVLIVPSTRERGTLKGVRTTAAARPVGSTTAKREPSGRPASNAA
jgi:nucleotide-binding universal stress UspA family protein